MAAPPMKRALEYVALVVGILSGLGNAAAGVIVFGEVFRWWNLL